MFEYKLLRGVSLTLIYAFLKWFVAIIYKVSLLWILNVRLQKIVSNISTTTDRGIYSRCITKVMLYIVYQTCNFDMLTYIRKLVYFWRFQSLNFSGQNSPLLELSCENNYLERSLKNLTSGAIEPAWFRKVTSGNVNWIESVRKFTKKYFKFNFRDLKYRFESYFG